jgi:hypothetical protein
MESLTAQQGSDDQLKKDQKLYVGRYASFWLAIYVELYGSAIVFYWPEIRVC